MNILFYIFFIMLPTFWAVGCGVKGDPVPPRDGAIIGVGKPDYKKIDRRYRVGKKTNGDNKEEDSENAEK